MSKTIALKNIPVGTNFKIWDREFTALKQENDKTFVLQNGLVTTMPFREENEKYTVAPNDFRDSSVKEYLNTTYINELKEAGANVDKDILPLTIDLKCTMGQHEYGTDIVQAGLLTLEQYGEFFDIIPLIKDGWWCLATPWKTLSRSPLTSRTRNVWSVYTNGDYNGSYYYYSYGVRPALNLNPELKVFYEDDSTVTDNNDSENWSDYIKYLHKWAVEHDDAEFKGNSPACYDEWRDNESDN